ncbi:hypothetical protein ACFE04_000435 [Oxalis oulophora]
MDMELVAHIVSSSTDMKDDLFDVESPPPSHHELHPAEIQGFQRCVDDIYSQVNKLEHKVIEVENFATTKDNVHHQLKGRNHVTGAELQHQFLHDAAAKRMFDLIRQFSVLFRQLTQHKWAWPFMQPVDVAGLGLHDYYKVIQKPMDFGTIKKKLEANGYNNVRDIYGDVRLVFKNAMKYNDERDDVHVMAKTLMEKFEEKWLHLLPKVVEEEKRRADEEAKVQMDFQLEQEDANANLARALSSELYDIDLQLEKLREMVVQKCRKMSPEEKKKLTRIIKKLPAEEIDKALQIVAEHNPSFHLNNPHEVNLDLELQNEVTLWRLRVHAHEVLKNSERNLEVHHSSREYYTTTNNYSGANASPKVKREGSDALNKTAPKKSKK